MRITAAGNVGIGTTTPTFAGGGGLHINTSGTDTRLHLTNTTTGVLSTDGFELALVGNDVYYDSKESAGTHIFYTAGTEKMRITSGGNVGIGTTSPATALQVNGTARATRINSTEGVVDFDAATGNNFISVSSGNMSIANNGTVNVYVSGSGNVGIGTSTPIAKLDVEGDFQLLNANYNSYSSSVSGTTTLATIPTSSYNGVFFDFVAFSGSNQRAGTLIGNWRSGNVQYTEYSSPDIGSTAAALTMSVALSGANALVQSVSAPGWAIKATYRTV
jgi:hypothetical protein